MTTPGCVQLSAKRSESRGDAALDDVVMRSFVKQAVGEAEPEDAVPTGGPQETDVWLTEWQVAEERFDIEVGQRVDWALVPMDQNWATQLFQGRRTINLQLDMYAEARRHPSENLVWTQLSGRVTRIDQVSVCYHQSEDSSEVGVRVADTGGAMQHSVCTLQKPRAHDGELVGWIVRVLFTEVAL